LGQPLSLIDRLGSQCIWAFQRPLAAFKLRALARRAERPRPLPHVSNFTSAKRALATAACRPIGSLTRAELRTLAIALDDLEASQELHNSVHALARAAGHDQTALFDAQQVTHELLQEIAEVFEELWGTSPPEDAPPEESSTPIGRVHDRIERGAVAEVERLVAALPTDTQLVDFPPLEACWRDWARLRAVIR